ncbi:MAG: hypothetical protein GY856_36870 [bacterium]|nr:hypothetical protein [bacterium]
MNATTRNEDGATRPRTEREPCALCHERQHWFIRHAAGLICEYCALEGAETAPAGPTLDVLPSHFDGHYEYDTGMAQRGAPAHYRGVRRG